MPCFRILVLFAVAVLSLPGCQGKYMGEADHGPDRQAQANRFPPPLVSELERLEGECREIGGTFHVGEGVTKIELNGDRIDDYILDMAKIGCPELRIMYGGNAGGTVTVYTSKGNQWDEGLYIVAFDYRVIKPGELHFWVKGDPGYTTDRLQFLWHNGSWRQGRIWQNVRIK